MGTKLLLAKIEELCRPEVETDIDAIHRNAHRRIHKLIMIEQITYLIENGWHTHLKQSGACEHMIVLDNLSIYTRTEKRVIRVVFRYGNFTISVSRSY